MENNKFTLLFVYNANSDIFSVMSDFAHKIVSPQTYQCNLCRITYSNIGMKQEWQSFIQSLPVTTQFLHKDEFLRTYPDLTKTKLPAIFKVNGSQPEVLVSADAINRVQNVDSLIELVKNKLEISKGVTV